MEHRTPHQSSTYVVSPVVREILAHNREHGHIHVLSGFRTGLGRSPREQLSLLWHIAPATSLLTVQASEPALTSHHDLAS